MYATRPARRAFTLLELLIVLAVVAGAAALSWPTVRGLLAKSEVLSAAKQLRAALARARLDAIESGTARRCRYLPGSGRFEIAALTREPGEAPEGDLSGPAGRPANEPTPSELPAAVRFDQPAGGDVLLGLDALPAAWDEESWSAPIVFLPNGRTSNASIRLLGRQGYLVDVALRGVTGTVVVGKPQLAEQSP